MTVKVRLAIVPALLSQSASDAQCDNALLLEPILAAGRNHLLCACAAGPSNTAEQATSGEGATSDEAATEDDPEHHAARELGMLEVYSAQRSSGSAQTSGDAGADHLAALDRSDSGQRGRMRIVTGPRESQVGTGPAVTPPSGQQIEDRMSNLNLTAPRRPDARTVSEF